MRIHTIRTEKKPSSIVVRHYDDTIVNVYSKTVMKHKESDEFEIGQFRIKYKNFIPKEYALPTHTS